jgi:hypothetical protein
MLTLHRSDAGTFVLTHPASQSVVVTEDPLAGVRELEARVGPTATAAGAEPAAPTAAAPARTMWAVAAAVPFVWLVVLHLSLGRLTAELAQQLRDPGGSALQREVDELRLQVTRLEARVPAVKGTPASGSTKPKKSAAPEAAPEDGADAEDGAAPAEPAPGK